MLKRITFILLFMLSACGNKSSTLTAPTPPPAPVAPVAAVLNIVQPARGEICISPVQGFRSRLTVPLTISETAGTGVAINFVRVTFFDGSRAVERQEIGANTIVAAFGTNRIEANGMLSTTITFDFNSFSTAAQITIGYTDDNGTNGSYSSRSIDVDVRPVCTLAASEGATL